jgi:hypothetical protein
MFERGEVRPRWGTAKKLADALALTEEERSEFYRIIDTAGKPKDVRETMHPPIPLAATLWKYLPGLLFQLPRIYIWKPWLHFDMCFTETVRACGALLSRIALDLNPPSLSVLADLREGLREIVRTSDHPMFGFPSIEKIDPVEVAAGALPSLWKARILGNPETTTALVRQIAEWQFDAGISLLPRNSLSVKFSESQLQARWGVHGIEPNEVTNLHDAMTVHWLWDRIGLLGLFGPITVNPYLRRSSLGKDLKELMTSDLEVIRLYCNVDMPDPDACTVGLVKFWDLVDRSKFATRAFDDPGLVRLLVGDEFPYGREKVLGKAAEIFSVLEDDPRERLRATG